MSPCIGQWHAPGSGSEWGATDENLSMPDAFYSEHGILDIPRSQVGAGLRVSARGSQNILEGNRKQNLFRAARSVCSRALPSAEWTIVFSLNAALFFLQAEFCQDAALDHFCAMH